MKDLPHHMNKLNRQIIRSERREQTEDEAFALSLPRKQSTRQIKKQAKEKVKKIRNARSPKPPTPEERNKKMAKRVPVFDQNKGSQKIAKPTKKKTPRI